jgi:hypothetical protein
MSAVWRTLARALATGGSWKVWTAVLVTVLVGTTLAPEAQATAKPKPWTTVNVTDPGEGWNYLAIYTTRENALATARLLLARGTWKDVRRLFTASFALDARYTVSVKRLGRLILRTAKRGDYVVYRSENGGYPFAPFAPEASMVRPR